MYKGAGTYLLSLRLVKIDINCETFVGLNYFFMLGCHAYCTTFIWNITGLLEHVVCMGEGSALCQFIRGAAGW